MIVVVRAPSVVGVVLRVIPPDIPPVVVVVVVVRAAFLAGVVLRLNVKAQRPRPCSTRTPLAALEAELVTGNRLSNARGP